MESIWCLFSVVENYNQPNNNLVAWYSEKPTISTLAHSVFNRSIEELSDSEIILVANLSKGTRVKDNWYTEYRLEQVQENSVLD